jgi:hypothetical protein
MSSENAGGAVPPRGVDGGNAMSEPNPPVVMTMVTDPAELAAFNARMEKFDRNIDWLQAHASEVYTRHRGRFICVAGQELFVADSVAEVLALARAAHPDDDGECVRYIPKQKLDRIYAHRRPLAGL